MTDSKGISFKATLYKARLTTLYVINLYLFRYTAQKFLAILQYACKISVQSDEKSDCVSAAQSLCEVALIAVFRFAGEIYAEALEDTLVNSREDNSGMNLTATQICYLFHSLLGIFVRICTY